MTVQTHPRIEPDPRAGAGAGTREPLVFSIPETARLLGISRALAYDLARRHELPTVQLGRRLLVPRAAIDALLTPRSVATSE